MKTSIYELINRDPLLLSWARYSIRYNETREQQALDFVDKARWNKHPEAGRFTPANVRKVLPRIEREYAEE